MADSLEVQLRQQLTAAMKAKDSKTANLVRMINTKIMERRTAEGFNGVVDDALILDVTHTATGKTRRRTSLIDSSRYSIFDTSKLPIRDLRTISFTLFLPLTSSSTVELVAGQPAAAHLRDRVLVAQEHQLEVVDRPLDQVPLVDAPEALHQQGLDVELEGGLGHRRRRRRAGREPEPAVAPAQGLVDQLRGLAHQRRLAIDRRQVAAGDQVSPKRRPRPRAATKASNRSRDISSPSTM
jgi:hypothetical protein